VVAKAHIVAKPDGKVEALSGMVPTSQKPPYGPGRTTCNKSAYTPGFIANKR